MRDVGAQHEAAAIRRLFEFAHDLLATIDRDGRFTTLNPAWERTLGFPCEELLGSSAADLLHPLDRDRALPPTAPPDRHVVEFAARYRRKDGGYRWLHWSARWVEGTWYTVARDVTDNRQLELRAARDPLTGLANRGAVVERLRLALAGLEHRPGLVAVLFVDLDHFKVINDAHGHELGDRFLCAAAARLLDAVRTIDAVARFGGDEFVVLVEEVAEIAHVVEIARRLVAAFERPIRADGHERSIGASVGAAVAATPTATADALLREADMAMYRAKARGGGCYELFGAAPPRRSRSD